MEGIGALVQVTFKREVLPVTAYCLGLARRFSRAKEIVPQMCNAVTPIKPNRNAQRMIG